MRILGLDYGDISIGVAVSDQLHLIAYAVEIIFKKSVKDFAIETERLSQIINNYDVKKIVIGMPKNLDNSCGIQCEKTLLFKKRIEKSFPDIEFILWDERFSTSAAQKNLSRAGINSFKQKKIIYKIAAVFILQGYLDFLNFKEDKNYG